MSLINKVLGELAAREQQKPELLAGVKVDPATGERRPAAPHRPAVFAAILAAAAVAGWVVLREPAPVPPPATAIPVGGYQLDTALKPIAARPAPPPEEPRTARLQLDEGASPEKPVVLSHTAAPVAARSAPAAAPPRAVEPAPASEVPAVAPADPAPAPAARPEPARSVPPVAEARSETAAPPSQPDPAAPAPTPVATAAPAAASAPPPPLGSADSHYEAATAALQQGQWIEAERHLRDALRVDPARHDAREALGGLLINQRRLDDAQAVLEAGRALGPQRPVYRKLLGHLALERGQPDVALALLQEAPPAIAADPVYHELLAAACQQLGRHSEASMTYRLLLQLRPNQAAWWVGYGISREALNQPAQALEAYHRARRLGGLDPRLLDHASRRIAELTPAAGGGR